MKIITLSIKSILVSACFAWALPFSVFADYVTTDSTGVPHEYHTAEEQADPSQGQADPYLEQVQVSVILAPGVSSDVPVNTGSWYQDETGWRYRLGDGNEVCGNWYLDKDRWYYFEPDGYMTTGLREVNGVLYYFDPTDGYMVSGQTVTLPDGRSITLEQDGSCVWPYRPITVIPPEEEKSEQFHQLDRMCDDILSGIVTPEMSDRDKANKIFGWIRSNLRYVSGESGTDWVKEAIDGIRSGRGECYTYYAVSQALLTRCGMDCIQVIRSTDNNHYWLLVRTSEGWYHFDTTPRNGVQQWVCLLTDAQLKTLPKASGWIFDETLYPRTPQ